MPLSEIIIIKYKAYLSLSLSLSNNWQKHNETIAECIVAENEEVEKLQGKARVLFIIKRTIPYFPIFLKRRSDPPLSSRKL